MRGKEPHTSAIMPPYGNLGGEAREGVLTGGVDSTVEEDDFDGETSLQWKKVLQNWLPSCARGPRTLGITWPATRSMEEELIGGWRKSVTGSAVGVKGVELELQNQVQKHHEPMAKLGAEGIKEWEARTLANWR
jgi:hypothetical protein